MILGYGYFSVAANMPVDCEALGWRLQMEHASLLDWAESAGLLDEDKDRQKTFDLRLRVDPVIVNAVLNQIQFELSRLSHVGRNYEELQVNRITGAGSQPGKTTVGNVANTANASGQSGQSGGQTGVTQRRPLMPSQRKKVAVKDLDLTKFSQMLSSVDLPLQKRKYTKGFNHVMEFGKKLKDVGKNPSRIVWAVHDKENFEKGLKRISELTGYLQRTLGDTQMNVLLEQAESNCMALLQLTRDVKSVQNLLGAVLLSKNTLSNSSATNTTTVVNAVGSRHTHYSAYPTEYQAGGSFFESITLFALHYRKVLAGSEPTVVEQNDITLNPRSTDLEVKGDSNETSAIYKGKDVWIEWKRYRNVLVDVRDGRAIMGASEETLKRVKQLVVLLESHDKPPVFSIPHCIGYVKDTEKEAFGFIYEASSKTPSLGPPQSLSQLLRDASSSRPGITERLAMARDMAVTLLCLHAVGWLHKSLRTESILFFVDQNGLNFCKPYIAGFEYARPDEQDLTVSGPPADTPGYSAHCHPNYRRDDYSYFRKTYDIYSLGVILLEIAYWKPIEDIIKSARSAEVLTEPLELDLFEKDQVIVNGVKDFMGERYSSAVHACIGGPDSFKIDADLDQSDPVVSAAIQQAFMALVVDALKSIAL